MAIILNLQPWLNLSLAIKTLTSMWKMNNPTNLFNSSLALCLIVTGQYLQAFNVFTDDLGSKPNKTKQSFFKEFWPQFLGSPC